jgi:photosystem II stability/assembly factor-like uncharacterized protein
LANVYFIDQNNGFVVGAGGTILKTTDAGESWQIKSSGTKLGLTNVMFPSQQVGYAVGGSGYWQGYKSLIIKTFDGGQTWNVVFYDSIGPFSSVFFIDDLTGYVGGDSGVVFKTINGGNIWTTISIGSSATINDIVFTNSLTGFLAGSQSTLLKTKNGGISWTDVSGCFPGNSSVNSLAFPTVNIGYALSYNLGPSSIAKTTDGGDTWNIIENPPWTTSELFFSSPDTGYVSGCYQSLRTTDGGTSWEIVNSPSWFSKIHFTDAYTGFFVDGEAFGDPKNPVIMKTDDFGESWIPVVDIVSLIFLKHLEFPVRNKGFALGDGAVNGQALRTLDGHTWGIVLNTIDTVLVESHFLNENLGYVCGFFPNYYTGHTGVVYVTRDGGGSWEMNSIPGHFRPFSISFINDSTGFMSGSSGLFGDSHAELLQTNSWGNSWNSVFSDSAEIFQSIKFTSSVTGYLLAVNPFTTIFKTTDGGITWDQVLILNGYPPSTMYFFSNNFGFLIPINGPTLYRTTDAGMSWDTLNGVPWIRSLDFINLQEGFSVGNNGEMHKTQDGGETWVSIESPTVNSLNDLFFFNSDTGYVVGAQGTILYTTDGGYPVFSQQHLIKESLICLNYPNPFSKSTTISYSIENRSDVVIEVFRLGGEKILSTKIMNQSAGNHTIPFDGSNFPAGIYLYRIKANHEVKTNKMIILH